MKKVAILALLAVLTLMLLAGGSWMSTGTAGTGREAQGTPWKMQGGGKDASLDRQGVSVARPHPRGLPRRTRGSGSRVADKRPRGATAR